MCANTPTAGTLTEYRDLVLIATKQVDVIIVLFELVRLVKTPQFSLMLEQFNFKIFAFDKFNQL